MKKLIYLFFMVFIIGNLNAKEIENKKYNRIVSMSMAGDEILFDLINRERIIAFSGHSSVNEMASILNKKLDRYEKIDNNIEKIIDMEPDLVIAANWLKKEIADQLEDADINVYTYKTSTTFEEQKELIMELAILLDAEEKGKEIVKNMDNRLAVVQDKIKRSGKSAPRILEYSHTEGTNGKGSIFDDMIQKIYGINLATEIGIGRFAKLSKEKVIEIDPDIILVPTWENFSDIKENDNKILDFIKKDNSYKDLKAVKNNRIYAIPGKYVYIYSQYVIEGIEDLAQTVYQFKDEEK